MSSDTIANIEDLLKQAGNAHHVFEQQELGGVYDEDWPRWYADWVLAHGLQAQLRTVPDVDTLTTALVEINAAHQAAKSSEAWAEFAARTLYDEFG